MTFEEFFKKKKINLETLNQGDPGLFTEFKEHYEAMGEKSFDHTKKFWFNKLRRVYPLPPEVKTEKLRMENRLAEQTITEMLSEPAVHTAKARVQTPAAEPAEKVVAPAGFKPRFKPGMPKSAEPKEETTQSAEQKEPATTAESTPSTAENMPKIGFKPRFKAGVTKPAEPTEKAEEKSKEPAPEADELTATPAEAPKMGFKPRFKAGVTKPAQPSAEEKLEEQSAESAAAEQPSVTPSEAPKMGFKPRFKAGVTKQAGTPTEETPEEKPAEAPATQPEATAQSSTEAPKLGFKPKFKAGVTKTVTEAPEADSAPGQQDAQEEDKVIPPADENEAEAKPANVSSAPKGFKPRFKAGVTNKPKEAEEKGNVSESATATPEVNAAAEQQQAAAEIGQQVEKPEFEKEKEQAREQYGNPEQENKHLSPEEGIADLENKKPAYKPRFNAKNFKPKSEE
jgi:hypothetical protein